MGERGRRGKLPRELTAYVGRKTLLQDVVAAVRGDAALLVLTGPGGVGKTRLALQVGRALDDEYPDGVWLVELAALPVGASTAAVVGAVAAALEEASNAAGGGDQAESVVVESLVDSQRDRRLLLLLDNCEHVLDSVRPVVRALLRGAPGLRIVATSRERLALTGERLREVEPLDVSGAAGAAQLEELPEAAQLFVMRAADLGIQVGAGDWPAVGRLCRRLAGLPLAIELAASRVRGLGLAGVLGHLDDVEELLAGGDELDHPSHGALDDTVAWSYELCNEDQRVAWRDLAVLAADFSAIAAQAVMDRPGTSGLLLLDDLVSQSILHAVPGPDGALRYRMLEPLRQWALRHLGRSDQAVSRAADYFGSLVATAAERWCGPDELVWLERLRIEVPHLLDAVSWYLDEAGDPQSAMDIVINGARARVWAWSGQLGRATEAVGRVLASRPAQATPWQVSGWAWAAWVAASAGDSGAARRRLAQARNVAAQLSDEDQARPDVRLSLTFAAGAVPTYVGVAEGEDPQAVIAHLREAYRHYGQLGVAGDEVMAALTLTWSWALLSDDVAAAERAAEMCLQLTARRGAPWAMSWAQWAAGLVHLVAGRPTTAVELASEAFGVQHDTRDRWGPPWSILLRAWAAAGVGDQVAAARLIGAGERLMRRADVRLEGLRPLHRLHEQALAEVRAELGARAEVEIAAGAELGESELAELVLADPVGDVAPHPGLPGGLTPQEWRIAQALPKLRSNQLIARDLVISPRTVERHLTNIYNKLRLDRVGLVMWVGEVLAGAGDGGVSP